MLRIYVHLKRGYTFIDTRDRTIWELTDDKPFMSTDIRAKCLSAPIGVMWFSESELMYLDKFEFKHNDIE